MGTAVLELPRAVCAPAEIGNLGAFFEPSQPEDYVLGSKESRLIGGLLSQLDTYLLAVASARSTPELDERRREVWPKYVRGLRALQDTFINIVPEPLLEQALRQAMVSAGDDLRKKGEALFGKLLTEQAEFTLWTIGKIRILGREITTTEVVAAKRQQDSKFAQEYRLNSLWAQLHLDVLLTSVKFESLISADIRESICDGLRSAVNAYAIMKDALALRVRPTETEGGPKLPWDDEDENLLKSSMRDVNADFSSDV